jgi:hypothetical protein
MHVRRSLILVMAGLLIAAFQKTFGCPMISQAHVR